MVDSLAKITTNSIKYDLIVIISPREKHTPYYFDKYKDADLYYKLNEEFLDNIPSICDKNNNVLILLDDCFNNCSNIIKEKIKQLVQIKNLTLFITCQYPLFSQDFVDTFDHILFARQSLEFKRKYYAYVKNNSLIENFVEYSKMIDELHLYDFLDVPNTKQYSIKLMETCVFNEIPFPLISICGSDNQLNAKVTKTILFNMIQESKKIIDHVVVISKDPNKLYDDITESIYPDISIIQKIYHEQKINKQYYVIIFDEIKPYLLKDRYIVELLYNARHHGISCIFISNNPLEISAQMVSNFDYVLVNCGFLDSIEKKLWDRYFSYIKTFKLFRTIYEAVCFDNEDYLMANMRSKIIQNKTLYMTPRMDDVQIKKYPRILITCDQIESDKVNFNDKQKLIIELKETYEKQQIDILSLGVLFDNVCADSNKIKEIINKLLENC